MKVYDIFTGEVSEKAFATSYAPQLEVVLEPCDDRSITEEGYIPPEVQIREMIEAGQRLDLARKERFAAMSQEEEEQLEPDVTMQPGVDVVDVMAAARSTSSRLEEQARVQKEKEAAAATAAMESKFQEAVNAKVAELQKKQP